MHITIIGAHGQIGRRLVRRLARRDATTVRAMIRDESQRATLESDGAEVAVGDLEGAFAHALEGTDAVVFTAGSGASTGADKTLLIDLWGARRAVDAAARAGIDRFVLVSSIGTRDPLQGPASIRPYLVAKRAADDHLRSTDLAWTVVRPGRLTDAPGTGQVAAGPALEPGEVTRDDVAHALEACLVDGLAIRTTFELMNGDTPIHEALAGLGG